MNPKHGVKMAPILGSKHTYTYTFQDRNHIIHYLIQGLLSKNYDYMRSVLDELIQENHRQGGSPTGFRYAGVFYTLQNPNVIPYDERKEIHPSLKPRVIAYLKEQTKLELDEERLRHGLGVVLASANTPQDVRDSLPDFVIPYLYDLALPERSRPEAWVLAEKPLLRMQYDTTRELLKFYHANQILY